MKYFGKSLHFGMGGEHVENFFWTVNNLPSMAFLKRVIILCTTINNLILQYKALSN